jgi:hypothetical protein
MDADGNNHQQLTFDDEDQFYPSFSPDGNTIVYSSKEDGGSALDIWVINANGSNRQQLTFEYGNQYYPCYSPDGSKIVYCSREDYGIYNDIWMMNADGSYHQRLTNEDADQLWPSFSPDGSKIAYHSKEDGDSYYDVWILNMGSEPLENTIWINVTLPSEVTFISSNAEGNRTGDSRWTFYNVMTGEHTLVITVEVNKGILNGTTLTNHANLNCIYSGDNQVPSLSATFDIIVQYFNETEEIDTDGDGIPDSEDDDDDNDGHLDENDHFPLDPTRWDPLTEISIINFTTSNENPSEGEVIIIGVDIENLDSRDNDVIIKFYLGNPNSGGTMIGTSQEVNIGPDSFLIYSQSWTAITGNHTLYVVIEHNETTETLTSSFQLQVLDETLPSLVLSLGDLNIYRFEPGEERTIFVEVTCYNKALNGVHLIVLDDQNLTIDSTVTPPRNMLEGETTKFYLRIRAPQLPEGKDKMEWDITIQAIGDGEIASNSEELDIVVSKDALSFFNPVILAGAVATGSLATLGAAAAASRRNENWKYLLLLSFAVPLLYTRIHGKKTLDNFVRGQVFGHIQSQPGTHFNDIKKTLQLGNGNLAYHLQKLEKEGFIKYPEGDLREPQGVTADDQLQYQCPCQRGIHEGRKNKGYQKIHSHRRKYIVKSKVHFYHRAIPISKTI